MDDEPTVVKVHALNEAVARVNALVMELVGAGYRVDMDIHTREFGSVARTHEMTTITVDTFKRIE